MAQREGRRRALIYENQGYIVFNSSSGSIRKIYVHGKCMNGTNFMDKNQCQTGVMYKRGN